MKLMSTVLALAATTAYANTLEYDCSSSQSTAVTNANRACASMASAAAEAAESGSAETIESFFKDSSQSTRSAVAASFRKVAEECSTTAEVMVCWLTLTGRTQARTSISVLRTTARATSRCCQQRETAATTNHKLPTLCTRPRTRCSRRRISRMGWRML
jgi:hypothetical protein